MNKAKITFFYFHKNLPGSNTNFGLDLVPTPFQTTSRLIENSRARHRRRAPKKIPRKTNIFLPESTRPVDYLERTEKRMGLLHHVDAVHGRLAGGGRGRCGGGGGARRRVDGGRTATAAGGGRTRRRRRQRRRRGRETVHGDVPAFRGREPFAQAVQVLGIAEIEVGLGQRPAASQMAVPAWRIVAAAAAAGHRRPMSVRATFLYRRRRPRTILLPVRPAHVLRCEHKHGCF